jgi:N-dimethylarginine dimethylaminohydrolase
MLEEILANPGIDRRQLWRSPRPVLSGEDEALLLKVVQVSHFRQFTPQRLFNFIEDELRDAFVGRARRSNTPPVEALEKFLQKVCGYVVELDEEVSAKILCVGIIRNGRTVFYQAVAVHPMEL